jgi:Spy/CpxP family protein refolding chaperone
MRRILWGAGLLALMAVVWVEAQPADRQPGQSRGGRGGMMTLESDWALICFELRIEKKAYDQLWAAYQQAWAERKEMMAQLQKGEIDQELFVQQLQSMQEELNAAQQAALTPDQLKQLAALKAERQNAWQGMGQRGQGRGQGQGQR